jgi:aminodeoxyfutalosine deaminase
VDLGTGRPPHEPGVEERDLGRSVILPGLVNAHTHLELSWLWGRVPPATSLPAWVSALMAQRGAAGGDDPAWMRQGIVDAIEAGTAAVGDVANTAASVAALAASRLHGVVFRELIGFAAPDPEQLVAAADAEIAGLTPPGRIHVHLAPHAPYSVSPALLGVLARRAQHRHLPCSIHVGESAEEVEFLQTGRGPWREVIEARGAWNPHWRPPGCRPVEYLEQTGLLGPRLLAVHGVQCTDAELRLLASRGATLVTCPRSNVWVGVGSPPIARFYRSGVRVAVGTDSLASATDLNLFSELASMHHLAPDVAPARLLASATREGALALGLTGLGAIQPGATARLIAVDLPVRVQDVERYLVEGIDPGQIDWV